MGKLKIISGLLVLALTFSACDKSNISNETAPSSGSSVNSSTETSKITKNASSDVNDSCLIAAENAANIVMSIDRKNVRALVTVSLIDFSLDGFPELVISYDVGNGNSFVENDVYDLQSGNNESIFSFRSSGISRDYEESVFLYENYEAEKFYAFIYGVDSGNYLKAEFVDKLSYQSDEYSVLNVFSARKSTDESAESEFFYDGKATDEITLEREKSKWFSNLSECEFSCEQISIEVDDWNNEEALEELFESKLTVA